MKLIDGILKACKKYGFVKPQAMVNLKKKDKSNTVNGRPIKLHPPGVPGATVINFVKKK